MLVDRARNLSAVNEDCVVVANILRMEVGVVVVPRRGNGDSLLVDRTYATLIALELQRRSYGDILVNLCADVALGILALVVTEELGAGNTCLRKCCVNRCNHQRNDQKW